MSFRRRWRARLMSTASITLTTVSTVGSGGAALALDDRPPKPSTDELLLKKLEAMERRIQMLEGQLKQKQATAPAPAKPTSAAPPAQPGAIYARAPLADAPAPARSVSSDNGP